MSHRHRPRRPAPRFFPPAAAQALEPRVLLATFTVTSIGVAAGSLRQAITDANANPGADTIRFNIPTSFGPVYNIASALPQITGTLHIDGTTQPGYTEGRPVVQVLGPGGTNTYHGLHFLNASNSRVRGLAINAWGGSAIRVEGGTGMVVESNWIGLSVNGTSAVPNGVGVYTTGSGGRIGGTTVAQRNVISGNNGTSGVGIDLAGDDNVVVGNYIGTAAAGNAAVANRTGVLIRGDRNRVGGTTAAERNLISGNVTGVHIGVYVPGGVPTALDNVVSGNWIGPDRTGLFALPNTGRGVWVRGGAGRAVIGGTAAGAGNIISGNNDGVTVDEPNSIANPRDTIRPVDTRIEGNVIGLNPQGTGLGNTVGIRMRAAGSIGGTTPGARNVISANTTGLLVDGGVSRIEGNYIGLDPTGVAARPNGVGVSVIYPNPIRIGGREPGAGNVISGNSEAGVRIANSAPQFGLHRLEGNRIGTNAAGTAAVPNAVGVELLAPAIVGGDSVTAGNLISGNTTGVRLEAGRAEIRRNFIGTDATGAGALGNQSHGVHGAGAALIGSVVEANIIAHNGGDGIRWSGDRNNAFLSNSIYLNGGLGIDLGDDGVTPNDPRDPDTGPNGRQNFPVITSVVTNATQTTVTGTLDSRPNFTYRIQIFSSRFVEPSLHGEGEAYLGEVTVATDASGAASFTASVPAVYTGEFVTATASRVPAASEFPQVPETSEFSRRFIAPQPDVVAPRVTGVFVSRDTWPFEFEQQLRQRGMGERGLGYAFAAGPGQLAPLPWVGINTISIRFSEPVEIQPEDLVVTSAAGAAYAVENFDYHHATRIAVWKLRNPIGADRVRLTLESGGAAGVTDLSRNALDGEWANGSASAWPTGDGAPGGDLVFDFNVLPGDVNRNGFVSATDLALVRRAYGSTTMSPAYSVLADLDGNGRVNVLDLLYARQNQASRLP